MSPAAGPPPAFAAPSARPPTHAAARSAATVRPAARSAWPARPVLFAFGAAVGPLPPTAPVTS
ncbi:MAG: hypothetical protein KatS3mg010_0744 [Acidimicrobiia bacterium]|nr:MAG: hypothetical protein KatS3mg010_0744 [Acidimicrobiia bacterium]